MEDSIKIAFIHDWLLGMRGGEKVLEAACELFPRADIHTLLHKPDRVSRLLNEKNIRVSWLQKLPLVHEYYRYLLPLMPHAIGRMDVSSYDLVVSFSHCTAKGARINGIPGKPRPAHVCYCHSPMRYIYDQFEDYFSSENSSLGGITRLAAQKLRSQLAQWDRESSRQVDDFIANSENVKRRIEKCYARDAEVIYPPVDVDYFLPRSAQNGRRKPYYLVAGALVPYKRVDLAIAACRMLNVPLKIVGIGTEELRLRNLARGAPVEFLGWQSSEALRAYYQECEALLFPQEEDFGIAAVEAMACGKPVIAYRKGGALETVLEGKTGLFFNEQTPQSLAQAMERARKINFDADLIRENAGRFHQRVFKARFSAFIEQTLERRKQGKAWPIKRLA